MLTLDIQRETDEESPDDRCLRAAAERALEAAGGERDAEISLRIVDTAEMGDLNARYRGRTGPTNVLSFPAELPDGIDLPLLGDIAICAPVVKREALDQGKAVTAHWEHMLVHGVLHLLGHDHENDTEAETMENLEREILAALGRPDPYAAQVREEPVREAHG